MTDPPARHGVWLGIDVGSVRVGVARCDPDGLLAVPVQTVRRDRQHHRDLDELAELVAAFEVVGVVLGLPRTLAGREGPAAEAVREFGVALAQRIAPVSVEFVDERMTSVLAQRNLSTSGVRSREQRAVVDQAAAVEILQSFLNASRQRRAD